MAPPRKHNPEIPSWIDQGKLPVGAYWNRRDRYWYTLIRKPKMVRIRLANADATLWEINEALALPTTLRDATLSKLMHDFSRSDKFRRLAISTQQGYAYCSTVVQRFSIGLDRHFSDMLVADVTTVSIQRMVDAIAATHRSKANLVKRYLSTTFVWGIHHGVASSNPAFDVKAVRPNDDLDSGVIFAVPNVPAIKPNGMHRIRWISDNIGAWMFDASQILEKSIHRIERITADGGIYFLTYAGCVCYVGKASCIRTRVGEHRSKGVPFDRVAAIRGIPKWAMDEVEQCYIARLNPALNVERSRFGQLHEIPGIDRYVSL
jgi:hypothetical protein